jgi:catechol O-methyltransferase
MTTMESPPPGEREERDHMTAFDRVREAAGRRLPFLRWSVIRMGLGVRRLLGEGQVGDGREDALADHVIKDARPGDLDDAIGAVDEFCYRRSAMMNVGDEKGAILDRAVQQCEPHRLLELGTYCGYSAMRIVRAMPADAHLWTIEFNAANADVARRIWAHAGVADRITVVVGSIGDGGDTMAALRDAHGFVAGDLDFVFVDHNKSAYLPDLKHLMGAGWLHPGTVVVADNVRVPGAPGYRAYMRSEEGRRWRTVEHRTHVEYQSLVRDLVLESTYMGDQPTSSG